MNKYKLPKDKQIARLLTAADIKYAFELAKELEPQYIPDSFYQRVIQYLKLNQGVKRKKGES